MGGLGGSGGGPSTRAQQTVVAVRDSPDDLNKSLMRTTKSELIAHPRPFSSRLNVGRTRRRRPRKEAATCELGESVDGRSEAAGS